jgi:iron complex transport system substrate-binding protein
VKRFFNFLSITIIGYVLWSCGSSIEKQQKGKSKTDTLECKYAKGFRVVNHEGFTEVSIFNPWQKSNNVQLNYLLYNDEKAIPKIGNYSCKIKLPLNKVICLSTTHISFVDALHKLETIKAISGINFVNNTIICKGLENGSIVDVGYERSMNYEAIASLKPDLVFAYGVESDISGYISKFNELGIPVVLVGEYLETHPLAKTEWIKFFGEFFEQRQWASQIFDSISLSYLNLKLLASNTVQKPTVIASLPWNGTWYISGNKTYMATLIADAGGNYVWNDLDSRESLPIDFELVFTRSGNADVWINLGAATDLKFISNIDKRLTRLKPFMTGKLYNNNARLNKTGGNDYWESGTMQPQLILNDLIKIFHPELAENYSFYYYKKLN